MARKGDTFVIFGKAKDDVKNVTKSSREVVAPKPMDVDKVTVHRSDEDGHNDNQRGRHSVFHFIKVKSEEK